jgi:hypothetical protein
MRSTTALNGFRRALFGLAVVIGTLTGCADTTESLQATPESPSDVVLELFRLVPLDNPTAETLDGLFGDVGDEKANAALLDAIQALRPVAEVEIIETYPMNDLLRISFDLQGQLAGGGVAEYSVQLDSTMEPGTIVWFSGPGVEWPTRRRRGDGLSTSAPPTATTGG